jgi:aminopeptidase N
MKKFLLLAALLPLFAFSQDTSLFQKELASIAEAERKAAEGLLSSGLQSVASGNFDVHHYRCEWQLDPAVRYIRGKVTASFTMVQAGNTITFDLANQLNVDSVVYHGAKITFQKTGANGLQVQFPANISASVKDSVSIFYQGVPAGAVGFGSFYQGAHAGVPVIWTLSEPYGAKDWWPCKDDLVDKADSIDVFMTHPSAYTASTNGMMMSRLPAGGSNVVTHFKHRYRIVSYLVAIALTNYVVNNDTVRVGNKVYPFISYAYPEDAASFFASEIYAKMAFRDFTQLFEEYPFAAEKYGHTQFGWSGGMEHQTNSFMFNTSPNLSAHELGHQWFGNKVTCGSWHDIWLNEGFATYSSILFTEKSFPSFLRNTLQSTLNNVTSQPGGSLYVPDTTNVNRIFDNRLSYNKGAYVVHMLRWVLGDSNFFRGLRRYLNDPKLRYNFARTEDLQRNLEAESGKDLGTFFQKWVFGEGYPNYTANWYQVQGSPWVTVRLDQTTSHSSVNFFDMPVALEFRNATQSVTFIANHQQNGQVFSFNPGFAVDTVIIDPNLWLLSRTKISRRSDVQLLAPDDIQLYPNPSPRNAQLRVRNTSGTKLHVRLFNAAGQLLFRRDVNTSAGADIVVDIPLMRYPRGVYMLEIRNDRDLKIIRRIVH